MTNGQVSLHLDGVQDARISYFDPSNQATVDRFIVDAPETELDGEGEEENAQATLANVEEMMEGYEWVSENVIGRKNVERRCRPY